MVLSHCNKKLKQWMDQCYSLVLQLGYSSVPGYSSVLFGKQRKIYPQGVWGSQPKRNKEKRGPQFCLLFLCFFSPPLETALCKLFQPGGLFFSPEVLTLVLGPSSVLFLQAFPSLSFSHCHSGLLFPILTT